MFKTPPTSPEPLLRFVSAFNLLDVSPGMKRTEKT
jgi:hypothetical protein